MGLTDSALAMIQEWVTEMQDSGRVATRMPDTVSDALAGQLASRLAVADPTLGDGPLQWDYQFAPFGIRVLDNAVDTSDEVQAALDQYSTGVLGFTTDLASVAGDAVHTVVTTTASAVAAAIGVPSWALWGGLAVGAYYVVTHLTETTRAVKSVAHAAVL